MVLSKSSDETIPSKIFGYSSSYLFEIPLRNPARRVKGEIETAWCEDDDHYIEVLNNKIRRIDD